MSKKGGKGSSAGEKPQVLHCSVPKCSNKPHRFAFCSEHYEWFKFGLVNRKGEKVPDFDKKIEHFEAYKSRKKKASVVA